jgi:hypothetical protein
VLTTLRSEWVRTGLGELLQAVRKAGGFFKHNKDEFAGLQSVLTIVALFVGGWWTWRAFFRGRQGYPRCDMTVLATHRTLDEGGTLLHVEASLRNHGGVLAELGKHSGFVRVHRVLPLDVDLSPQRDAMEAQSSAPKGVDPEPMPPVVWPLVGEARLPTGSCEVEPGETETFDFDFPIPADVRTVRLYVYARNLRKRRRFYWSGWRPRARKQTDIGWKATTLYDLVAPSGGVTMVPGKDRTDYQEAPESRPVQVTATPAKERVEKQQSPEPRPVQTTPRPAPQAPTPPAPARDSGESTGKK